MERRLHGGKKDGARVRRGELFCEARGAGPPLLLIAGALADAVLVIAGALAEAGQFTALARALAARWRAITYDQAGQLAQLRTSRMEQHER
jgi:hypothetical protein